MRTKCVRACVCVVCGLSVVIATLILKKAASEIKFCGEVHSDANRSQVFILAGFLIFKKN